MADEVHSKGTKLAIGTDADPPVFTNIPGVTGFTLPAPVKGEIEVTDLDSTAKEYIGDLPDNSEISFQLNLKKKSSGTGFHAAQEALEAAADDDELYPFRATLPAPISKTYTFMAIVKSFVPNAATGTQLTATVTIKPSGAVTRGVVA